MQGESSGAVFARAKQYSNERLESCMAFFREKITKLGLDPRKLCIAATGSVGRREALEASDLDLIVISDQPQSSGDDLKALYGCLVRGLGDVLRIPVSKGRSVMGGVALVDLADPDKIGGDKDDRIALTRRTLVLTEGAWAGGELSLRDVRKQILEAYSPIEDFYHPLQLCNDVARYYRQLCIDYNQRPKTEKSGWAEKNVKLRHSRKFWYFTTGVAIVAAVLPSLQASGDARRWSMTEAHDRLLDALELPTYERLPAMPDHATAVRQDLLTTYAVYLQEMGSSKTRERLCALQAKQRADDEVFRKMRESSVRLHDLMKSYVTKANDDIRAKFLDWFLL